MWGSMICEEGRHLLLIEQSIPSHFLMGPRSTGTVVVVEQSRGQLELAGLGLELIAAVAARSEDFCFVLRVFLVVVLHVVRTDHFRAAAVAAAGNGGLRLESFEPRSAC